MKKSVVAITHVPSSSCQTAASSGVSVPTSNCRYGAASGWSANSCSSIEGASLQPQPPPCARLVNRTMGTFMNLHLLLYRIVPITRAGRRIVEDDSAPDSLIDQRVYPRPALAFQS